MAAEASAEADVIDDNLVFPADSVEYDYLGRYGDCVDLNTLEDTWYIYPKGKTFAVTKLALATEELWKKHRGM